jgi:hypothetical protein
MFIVQVTLLIPLLLSFILGIKLYPRLHNAWKKYLIPVYPLTCCYLCWLGGEALLANPRDSHPIPWLEVLFWFTLLTLLVTGVWAGLVYLFIQVSRLWK